MNKDRCWKSNGEHNYLEVKGIVNGWMCECGASKNKLMNKTGKVYQVKYALTRNIRIFGDPKEDETYCAWCRKSVADIKKTEDLNKHLEEHDKSILV